MVGPNRRNSFSQPPNYPPPLPPTNNSNLPQNSNLQGGSPPIPPPRNNSLQNNAPQNSNLQGGSPPIPPPRNNSLQNNAPQNNNNLQGGSPPIPPPRNNSLQNNAPQNNNLQGGSPPIPPPRNNSLQGHAPQNNPVQNNPPPPPNNAPLPPPPNNNHFEQFTHLTPYSMPMQINVFGGMTEQSALQYDQTKQLLKNTGTKKPQDLEIRTEMIKRQLEPSYIHFKHNEHSLQRQNPNSQPLGVFTAPEWSFKRPGVPYTPLERQNHIESFKQISAQHPGMIVAPGTMVWQDDQKRLHNTAHVFFNGQLVKQIDKAHEGMDVTGYYLPNNQQIRKDLLDQGVKPKQLPFSTKDEALQSFTVRPEANDPYFEIGGRKFALEICADHANKRAKGQLPNHMPVDVQMIISNGSYLDQGSMVTRPGGIALGNDASVSLYQGQKNLSPREVQIDGQRLQQTIGSNMSASKIHMGNYPLPSNQPPQGGLDNNSNAPNLPQNPPQNPPPNPPNLDQN